MRTIFLIKQLIKDSNLERVSFELNSDDEMLVVTEPKDLDLESKIKALLNKEMDSYLNDIK